MDAGCRGDNSLVVYSGWTKTEKRGEWERRTFFAVSLPETPRRYSLNMAVDRVESAHVDSNYTAVHADQ